MLRATFDKAVWRKDRDVSEEWPCVGLPEMIGVDNGSDFKSTTFSNVAERGRDDPANSASMTLHELKKIFCD